MSYCRNNGKDSDVYVIPTGDGKGNPSWECVACTLSNDGRGHVTKGRLEMIGHLIRHRGVGHKVPEHALDRLYKELVDEDGPAL
jgi:hypothetical protein